MTTKEFEEYIQNNLVWVLHNVRVATGNIVEENRQLNKDYKREKTINKKLRERVSKAIEYIEQNEWYSKLRKTFINNLLDILKGVDKE